MPSECEQAIRGTLDAIYRELLGRVDETGVAVYYGLPNLPA